MFPFTVRVSRTLGFTPVGGGRWHNRAHTWFVYNSKRLALNRSNLAAYKLDQKEITLWVKKLRQMSAGGSVLTPNLYHQNYNMFGLKKGNHIQPTDDKER